MEICRDSVRVCAPGAAPQATPVTANAFSWEAATAAVEQLVRKRRPRKAALNVVLADTWSRYFVIDWPQQKLAVPEEAAFAAQAFVRIYEQPASDWLLTTVPTGKPGKRLLCGMQRGAGAALDSMLQRCGWRIERLTGAFAAGFDLAAPVLAGVSGYFIFSHDAVAHCARLEAGALTLVRGQVMSESAAAARTVLARRCAAVEPVTAASGGSSTQVPGHAFYSLLVDCDPADFPATAGRNLRRELLAGRRHPSRFLAEAGRQWLAA